MAHLFSLEGRTGALGPRRCYPDQRVFKTAEQVLPKYVVVYGQMIVEPSVLRSRVLRGGMPRPMAVPLNRHPLPLFGLQRGGAGAGAGAGGPLVASSVPLSESLPVAPLPLGRLHSYRYAHRAPGPAVRSSVEAADSAATPQAASIARDAADDEVRAIAESLYQQEEDDIKKATEQSLLDDDSRVGGESAGKKRDRGRELEERELQEALRLSLIDTWRLNEGYSP